jgi:hypothetical protein
MKRLIYLTVLALLPGCLDQNLGVASSEDTLQPPSVSFASPVSPAGGASESAATEPSPEEGDQPPPETELYQGGGG